MGEFGPQSEPEHDKNLEQQPEESGVKALFTRLGIGQDGLMPSDHTVLPEIAAYMRDHPEDSEQFVQICSDKAKGDINQVAFDVGNVMQAIDPTTAEHNHMREAMALVDFMNQDPDPTHDENYVREELAIRLEHIPRGN